MRLLVTAIACFIVLGLHSCSEDFTVASPYKQVTVVAGILDMKDTAHYIRIQKGFMDEHKSAINMSKEPDSSFYRDLEVKLYEYDTDQLRLRDSVILFRVDANMEGYQKNNPIDDQQFFTSPNYAYKFTNSSWENSPHALNPRQWYRLIIHNKQTGRTDSSDFVGIVNSDSNKASDGFYVFEFQQLNYNVDFSKTAGNSRCTGYRPTSPATAV